MGKIQKTLHGFSGREILNRITRVDTIGGWTKEVVSLPTFVNTMSHWNVERRDTYLLLTSGTVEKRVALTKRGANCN